MKIHHAVLKKAAKHKIELLLQGDGTVRAVHADLAEPVAGNTATVALEAAMKALGYKTGKPKVKKPVLVIANKSVVRKPYKEEYKTKGSGQGCGDRLDRAMRDALDGDTSLQKIAADNKIPFVWQALNKGLQRMNLSNVMRARIKRGESVKIDSKTVASL